MKIAAVEETYLQGATGHKTGAWFIKSVMVILWLTAILKLIGIASENFRMGEPDPVFSVFTRRQVLLIVAAIEIGVASWLLRRLQGSRAMLCIALLSGVFGLYRVAAWLAGWTGPCMCLGTPSESFGVITTWTEDWIAKLMLFWMLAGSLFFIIKNKLFAHSLKKAIAEGGTRPADASIASKRFLFGWALFLICTLWIAGPAQAQTPAVSISGEVLVQNLKKDGTVLVTENVPFSGKIDARHWLFTVDYGSRTNSLGFDGTNSCLIIDVTNNGRRLPPATIFATSYPYQSEPVNQLLWLAFGSADFFGGSETNYSILPALWNGGYKELGNYSLKIGNVEIIPNSGNLPKQLEYIIDTQQLLKIADSPFFISRASKAEIKTVMEGFKKSNFDGKTIARYSVQASTNVGGRSIPAEFLFEVLLPMNGKDFTLAQSFRGKLNRASETAGESFLPQIKGGLAIRDYRFSEKSLDVDSVSYIHTNTFWPPSGDPELVELFNEKKKAAPLPLGPVARPARRSITVILIACIFLSPIVILLLMKKTKKQQP